MAITDLYLLATNSVVFYFLYKKSGTPALIVWSFVAFLTTFIVEYAGVKTGKIFGDYEYGATMFLQVGKVPVVIAYNWIILILASYNLANKLFRNIWISPVLGSIFIVIFDIVMEPVAMKLDYWQWAGGIVPLQNYLAWFLISLVFSYILSIFRIPVKSRFLIIYFFIQLIYFSLFRISMFFGY